MSMDKKKIAVFFGGRSPEHDVSVVTGLQILNAIDQSKYEAHPVYVTIDGDWLYGDDILRDRNSYMLDDTALKKLRRSSLDPCGNGKLRLRCGKRGAFDKAMTAEFDAVIPAFHGLYGEDGNFQGAMELANVPYVGMRTLGSSILMDKVATKRILQSAGIPMLPYAAIKRPDEGYMIAAEKLEELMGDLKFPCILKPAHLGSSIGIAKVGDIEELRVCLPGVFEYDDTAILEPFVDNLVEYNVAVSRAFGDLRCSAIERPKTSEELLDFKTKYLSGNGKDGGKLGQKSASPVSEGMLSLTREINPDLPPEKISEIHGWALEMFKAVDGTGAPRIDFIGNSETGEVWLNEVNPLPGSFGYFLWEAADDPVFFTDFISALIEEAFSEHRKRALPQDPVPEDARLLKRRG